MPPKKPDIVRKTRSVWATIRLWAFSPVRPGTAYCTTPVMGTTQAYRPRSHYCETLGGLEANAPP